MDEFIKFCAKYLIILPLLVNIYIFWKLSNDGRRRMFTVILTGGLLSLILAVLASQLFNDPRPQFKDNATPLFPHNDDNGFPSDHTLMASFLALVAYGFKRHMGYALLLVAVLIGWARVAAHIHHGVDILASFAITVLAYFLAVKFIERFLGRAKSK